MKRCVVSVLINLAVIAAYVLTKDSGNFISGIFGLLCLMITPINLYMIVLVISDRSTKPVDLEAKSREWWEESVREQAKRREERREERMLETPRSRSDRIEEFARESFVEDSHSDSPIVVNNYYQAPQEERLDIYQRVHKDNLAVSRVMSSLYTNFLFNRMMRDFAREISQQTSKEVAREIRRIK